LLATWLILARFAVTLTGQRRRLKTLGANFHGSILDRIAIVRALRDVNGLQSHHDPGPR
jgi:hypothetical protein